MTYLPYQAFEFHNVVEELTMARPSEARKRMGTLKPVNFRSHPVWGGYEDDYGGSWVEPVDSIETLDEEAFDMLFVYCELRLADGTKLEGAVSIDTLDYSVYGVRFFQGEDLFSFVGRALPDTSFERLEKWLGKNSSEISPVIFSTPYHWRDATAIMGTIDLIEWNRRSIFD